MPQRTVSILEGIRNYVGDQATVTHALGCQVAANDTGSSYKNWRYVDEIEFTSLADNEIYPSGVELARKL